MAKNTVNISGNEAGCVTEGLPTNHLPDWNDLPIECRDEMVKAAGWYADDYNAGQCALDIYLELKKALPPQIFPLFSVAGVAGQQQVSNINGCDQSQDAGNPSSPAENPTFGLTDEAAAPVETVQAALPSREAIALALWKVRGGDEPQFKHCLEIQSIPARFQYPPFVECFKEADAVLAAQPLAAPVKVLIEAEARRYADMYPQSSDGRNTFVIFADWINRLTSSDGTGENQPEQRTGPHRASGETNSGSTGDSELTRSARPPSEAATANDLRTVYDAWCIDNRADSKWMSPTAAMIRAILSRYDVLPKGTFGAQPGPSEAKLKAELRFALYALEQESELVRELQASNDALVKALEAAQIQLVALGGMADGPGADRIQAFVLSTIRAALAAARSE